MPVPLLIKTVGTLSLLGLAVLLTYAQAPLAPPDRSADVTVRNLRAINSERLDFSPAFYQNGLVYVSSRQHSGPKDKKIAESFFELFYTELDDAGNPLRPEPFSVSLNSQKHEGPVTFNQAGDVLYFTRNNMENGVSKSNAAGVSHLKIYEARKGAYDWGTPTALPFSSDDYTVAHPSLSHDGRLLYFTSDMPGGHGGMDLYVAERGPEGWQAPRNLGARVNTAGNDVFPFIHPEGRLFFASNGHAGAGGLDLFYWDVNTERTPVNLGTPFNSAADDLSLILDDTGHYGYFASSRAGGTGRDDLYAFSSIQGLLGKSPAAPVSLALTFRSPAATPVAGAAVRIFEMSDNGTLKGSDLYTVALKEADDRSGSTLELRRKNAEDLGPAAYTSDTTGQLQVELPADRRYLLLATQPGYATLEHTIDLRTDGAAPTLQLTMDSLQCRLVHGRLFDRASARPLAHQRLELELGTGDRQLTTDAKGYWTTCLDGTDLVAATLRLSGYQEADLYFDPTALPEGGIRTAMRRSAEAPTTAAIVGKPSPVLAGTALTEGSVLVLENIYYEFDKSAIRAGAAEELDALLALLRQYPSMHIDLIAHTDARGTAKYNKELSQRRAASAKQYLVSKGISPNRVMARGAGESRLRNRCTTNSGCSEEEHAFNRRTEVLVTKLSQEVQAVGDPFDR